MAFISEIHLANGVESSTGVSQYVEVALTTDEVASLGSGDIVLATYQASGDDAISIDLATLTPVFDADSGFYVYTVQEKITNPDAGFDYHEAEAVALVVDGTVDTFYDIGTGTTNITALDGPAAGATSVNIPSFGTGAESIQFNSEGVRVDTALTVNKVEMCFAAGTKILVPGGNCPVEDLKPGDQVLTWQSGVLPIKAISQQSFGARDFQASPNRRPIRISAGALGPGTPQQDLLVSSNHKIVVSGPVV